MPRGLLQKLVRLIQPPPCAQLEGRAVRTSEAFQEIIVYQVIVAKPEPAGPIEKSSYIIFRPEIERFTVERNQVLL